MNRVKVAFWCRIMEVTLLTCLIFTPLLGQVIFWLSRGVPTGGTIEVAIGTITYECDSFNLCTTNNIVPFITYLCGDLIICLILWQLYKIFNNIRHKNIFSPQILKHIYCAGYFLILLSVYYIITDILIYLLQAPGEISSMDLNLAICSTCQ
ncbi:DUF2975 domain-containing protein [Pantoea sp. LMR881]|uniref:DUF2975 domain-containing protein n=1 Tax=Pantoea sp. LMR881 TaxID=3014336 RepID=UPI003FA75856